MSIKHQTDNQAAISRFARRARHSILLVSTTIGLAVAGPATAHHSFSMFDMNKTLTVAGVVREFQWKNPHVFIEMVVKQGNRQVPYSIEAASVGILGRTGWSRNSLAAGDKITMVYHPLRARTDGGVVAKVIKADGSVLSGEPM